MSDKATKINQKQKPQPPEKVDSLKGKLKRGVLCEAKDFANTWYKSRVLEVDEPNNKVLVHFLGWNTRHDQWFEIGSPDLKLFDKNNKKTISVVQKTAPEIRAPMKQFEVGSKVLAKWKLDNLYYPGDVLRFITKGSLNYYQIKFQDGVKEMVRSDHIRELTKEDQIILDKQKAEQELTAAERPVETTPSAEEAGDVDQETKENDRRKAEAELLLAIGQNSPAKLVEAAVAHTDDQRAADSSNQRKSTRVKKLKTFKDEIVYFPPSSVKTYNISPDAANSKSLVAVAPEEIPPPVNSKRKLSTSSVQGIAVQSPESRPAEAAAAKRPKLRAEAPPATETTKRKLEEEAKKARLESYFSSLKVAKSKKSIAKSRLNLTAPKGVHKEGTRKRTKKDMIKKLIESSQLQLRKQQELIESQLKLHRHEKTKRKMLKLLKKQRLIDEQRNFAMENLNSFDVNETNADRVLSSSDTSANHSSMYPSNEPIRCNFSNCDKTFRKQSLLEYHLKYHHYVDMKTFNTFDLEQIILSTPSVKFETLLSKQKPSVVRKADKLSTMTSNEENKKPQQEADSNMTLDQIELSNVEKDPDWIEMYSNDKNEDPYDVVHCACGNHSSLGFMIQCDVCLCWQHGDCLKLRPNQVPERHICWVCSEPDNKLRQLKYKSWMQIKNEKKSREILDSNSNVVRLDDSDNAKLRLLNLCSKKYFNLNLLMHTIEYQYSLMNKVIAQNNDTDSKSKAHVDSHVEKILMNISHLQDCATTKFGEFNKRLDEFEAKYQQNNKNALPRFFNLQELYKQLQSFVYA